MLTLRSNFWRNANLPKVIGGSIWLAALVTSVSASGQSAPFVFTQPAAPVRAANAVLNGMVLLNGLPATAWFEWGEGTNYVYSSSPIELGLPVAPIPTGVVTVSATITNSFPACHFRLISSNAVGVTYGQVQSFTRAGRLVAWGQNSSGQTNVPTGTNVSPLRREEVMGWH